MRKFVVGFILIMPAATVSGCFIEPYGNGGGGHEARGERGEHEGHGDRR